MISNNIIYICTHPILNLLSRPLSAWCTYIFIFYLYRVCVLFKMYLVCCVCPVSIVLIILPFGAIAGIFVSSFSLYNLSQCTASASDGYSDPIYCNVALFHSALILLIVLSSLSCFVAFCCGCIAMCSKEEED